MCQYFSNAAVISPPELFPDKRKDRTSLVKSFLSLILDSGNNCMCFDNTV